MSYSHRIIWSVDAFESPQLVRRVFPFLNSLEGCSIEPVYVLMSDEYFREYRSAAEKSLEHIVQSAKNSEILKPRILMAKQFTHREGVSELIKYAQRVKADLIVVSSHARKGLSRFFLGSFAETLLLYSPVPVICVPPTAAKDFELKKILFPTDFSKKSHAAYLEALSFCKEQKLTLTLFHQMSDPLESYVGASVHLLGGAWVPVRQLFKQDYKLRRQDGESWIKLAKAKGVKANFVLGEKPLSTMNAIIETAEAEKCSLIAMASQSGPWTSVFLGSIARQVVRASPLPVWVMHLKEQKKYRHPDVTLV